MEIKNLTTTRIRTTWKLDLLVTGLVVPLGPLMQGILETQGLIVTGHLEHGLVKVTPSVLCFCFHVQFEVFCLFGVKM